MEQFQPHNSIDPSLPAPTFFSTTTSAASGELPAISELPPMVNFSPAQPPIPNQTSYDGMIMAAISALREKDGSSRQAIARYIDRVYNNLPPNHSDLLTHNLKRLKNSGQITMVKHSYMLPSSGSTLPPPSAPPIFTTTASYSFSPPAASAPAQFMAPPPPPPASAPQFLAFPPQFMLNNMAPPPPPPPFPATTLTDAVATSGPSPPPSQPKKRGRPPKPKTDLAPAQNYSPNGPVSAQYQPNGPEPTQNVAGLVGSVHTASDGPVEVLSKRKPGRPRKEKSIQAQYTLPTNEAQTASSLPTQPPAAEAAASQNYPVAGAGAGAPGVVQGNGSVSGSEAMLVSLGLSDGPSPAKMRPRRSQKPTNSAPMQPAGVAQNVAKKRGRPRKANPAVAPPAPGVYPVQVPVGTSPPPSNRGRGRPRKYAVAPGAMANGMQPKKRGRKPKNGNQAAAFAVPVSFVLPEQMNAGGAQMMPQTIYVQTGGDASAAVGTGHLPITGGYNGVAYSPMKRGRGRPPRTDGGGPRKARKLTGRPLGRPRKNQTGSEEQSIEIVTLKGKIVYLQSKIKEAVPVIKAYLNGEEANAMGALGELEELAIADLSAPVNVKTQQQPPVQHMPAEQQ